MPVTNYNIHRKKLRQHVTGIPLFEAIPQTSGI